MSDILNTIIATKHREVAAQQALTRWRNWLPPRATPRPAAILWAPSAPSWPAGLPAVIAEVKKPARARA